MKRVRIVLFYIAAVLICSQAEADDRAIIRSILDENGLEETTVESVATFKEDRAIKLNLNNPDVAKDGFKTLPASIGQLDALITLTINDNVIDSLPVEIGNLQSLTELELKNNEIMSLPSTIGQLSALKVLDLRNNELRKLPPEIGQLDQLWMLQLWGNELSFLPEEIGDMESLKELYLRNNRLKSLPASIMKMDLNYLGIYDNKLCELDEDLDAWLKKKDDRYRSWQKCW
ncbi:MAG: leucine-rich repeat domain-containing protein [Chitinispirillaceae bacterium]